MNREQVYREFIPRLLKRSIIGALCTVVFLLCWYQLDAWLLWGYFLDIFFSMTSWLFDISFEEGKDLSSAAFFYSWKGEGASGDVGYKINNLNPTLAVLVLLMGSWPHKDFKSFLSFFAWSFLFTIVYHIGSVWVQVYYQTLSPGFADRMGLFWEDSLWYSIMNRVAGFDKFILRYYATFPVMGCALTVRYFTADLFKKKQKA